MLDNKITIFCDIDGTIFAYRDFGFFDLMKPKVIQSTADYLRRQYEMGSHIVITTARPYSLQEFTEKELLENNIPYHQLVMGIGHGVRVLINDLNPAHPNEAKAVAINLKRNEGF
jgi:hypothetical protein